MTNSDYPAPLSGRTKKIFVAILSILLIGVLLILNFWLNQGMWGTSDAIFQMRHDPLSDERLLGFTRCRVAEDLARAPTTHPSRVSYYRLNGTAPEEALNFTIGYATKNGWRHTGWREGAWIGEKKRILSLSGFSMQVNISIDPHSTKKDCNLRIGMWSPG
jgi:hypothetical protein